MCMEPATVLGILGAWGRCQEGLGWLLYCARHIGHMAGFCLLNVKGFLWARMGPETNAEMQELSWISGA